MFTTVEGEEFYSFSLRLSLKYLSENAIPFQVHSNSLQVGNTIFKSLQPSSGGYQTIDDIGYQILLRYRSAEPIARRVTLNQVLQGDIEPDWARDKIVLLGTTAPSAKDLFFTPYTRANREDSMTPGVVIHAQMVSQILSAVLDQRSPFQFWSDWAEALWIFGWSVTGGILAWRSQHPLSVGISGAIAITGLLGTSLSLFLQAFWVPLIPPILAFVGTKVMVLTYKRFYDASYDALTKLPNRTRLNQHLQRAIAQSKQQQPHWQFAVLYLGLDRFKVINESLGYKAANQVLQIFVDHLQAHLRSSEIVARVNEDEFAILVAQIGTVHEAICIADRLQTALAQPIRFNEQQFLLNFTVGIAINQLSYLYRPEDLLRDAQIAMHYAKSRGKSRHEVFAIGMREQVVIRMQLETDLRQAIEQQEFVVYYQPIVSLKTGQIAGFEALVRWQHPKRGMISPGEFIPVAEETGLIVSLGQWILEEACRQMNQWHQQVNTHPPLLISVNLSPVQFTQTNLVEQVEQTLHKTGLDCHSLKLEITESMMADDVESAIALLLRLKTLNLKLSIDDFGTGYSSLSYLHRFPIDTLKVDRSFVSRMEDIGENAEIVHTIINLGHNLGMDVIAEGVEHEIHLNKLRQLGCEYAQGYFLSKPLPAEAATALLEQSPQW